MDLDFNFLNSSKHAHLTESAITLEGKCQSAHLALSFLVSAKHTESEKAICCRKYF